MSDDEGLFAAPRGGAFPSAAPSEFVDFGWQDVSVTVAEYSMLVLLEGRGLWSLWTLGGRT